MLRGSTEKTTTKKMIFFLVLGGRLLKFLLWSSEPKAFLFLMSGHNINLACRFLVGDAIVPWNCILLIFFCFTETPGPEKEVNEAVPL